MLKRQMIITLDGSSSIHIPEWDEQYHSKHGAIQEAYHVFIKNGFEYFDKTALSILEIGLGTGLNCFITFLEAQKKAIQISYTGVEAFPITEEERKYLNFVSQLKAENYKGIFEKIHLSDWNKKTALSSNFFLQKDLMKFQKINAIDKYDLVYFDAFGPRVQPELWTEEMFERMYKSMNKGGVLVTYSAKGSVRRAMQSVGFLVEKLPGPPGKREMLRAVK